MLYAMPAALFFFHFSASAASRRHAMFAATDLLLRHAMPARQHLLPGCLSFAAISMLTPPFSLFDFSFSPPPAFSLTLMAFAAATTPMMRHSLAASPLFIASSFRYAIIDATAVFAALAAFCRHYFLSAA